MESRFSQTDKAAFNPSFLDYQELLQNAPLGLWSWNAANENFHILNAAMGTLIGVPPNSVLTTHELLNAVDIVDRSQLEELLFKPVPEGKEGIQQEIKITRSEAKTQWLQLWAHSIPQPTEQGRRLVGCALDVTALHQSRESTAAQQEIVNYLMEQSANGFFYFDQQHQLVHINQTAEQIFDVRQRDVRGKMLADVMRQLMSDSSLQDTSLLSQIYWTEKTRQPSTIEFHHAPTQRWLRASIYPRHGGIALAFNDVTQQKVQAERLQYEQQRMQQLKDSNIIGIAIISRQGIIVDANAMACTLLGFTPEEVAHGEAYWTTHTPSEMLDRDYQAFQRIEKQGNTGLYEREVIAKDDTRKKIMMIGIATDRDYEHIAAFMKEIPSQEANAQEATAQEAIVQEATVQEAPLLSNNPMLVGSQIYAIRNHALDVSIMLADAKNQLKKHIQESELHDIELTAQVEHAIDTLATSLHHLRQQRSLTDDIIDCVSLATDQLELQISPCDLSAAVMEAADDHEILNPEQQIILNMPYKKLWVKGDPARLYQILDNYLNAAFQYSQQDTPVTLTLEPGQDQVRCLIESSVGLTEEEIQQIREGRQLPRFMSSPDQKYEIKLLLNRQLITRHGGESSIEHKGNARMVIWFTLPEAAPQKVYLGNSNQ